MSQPSRAHAPVQARVPSTSSFLLFVAIAMTSVIGGCAGDGCTCAGPIPGGFPPQERAANAVQMRISDSGLTLLSQDPNALMSSLLGAGGLVFDVPPVCDGVSNPQICCDANGNPIAPCGPVQVDIQLMPGDAPRLELAPANGQSRLDVTVRARVRTLADMPIVYDTGLFDVDCNVAIDTEASGADDILLDIPVSFVQDPIAGTTRVEVTQVSIAQFDNGDLSLSGGFDCNIADLLVFAFKNSLVSTIESVVQETITDLTCKTCPSGDVGECGPFAEACTDNVCTMTGGQCLQELGVASRIPANLVLGELSPGTFGAIDIYDVLGGYASTDGNGLSFGALGGALPGGDISRRCGPSAPAPANVGIPESVFFQGNTRPDTGAPFHVALGVHQHQIEELSWSAYESGFLCMNVGTSAVELLSTDTMSLLMPSVLDLVHGRNAQMVLGIRPQSPPRIVLGPGTFVDDGTGNQIIDEPLLDVALDGLDIDFYAMIDDQFIRIMTLSADVRLPVNLDVAPDGALIPVMGDLDNAFQNLRVSNSEALIESPDQLVQRFPAVLDLALPMIVGSLGAVALPEVAGLELRVTPGGVTSVENNTFLAVFTDLAYAAPANLGARVSTTATISAMHVPDAAAFTAPTEDAQPSIELVLGATDVGGAPRSESGLEWSYRVNDGLWTPYAQSRRVIISRPAFWLQGRHHIEVRAREIARPWTADATPVVLEPIIDVTPPRALVVAATGWLMATDNVSRHDTLTARYRTLDGTWQELTIPGLMPDAANSVNHRTTSETSDLLRLLTIVVEDQAGNQTMVMAPVNARRSLVEFTGSSGSGCSVGDAGSADSSLWLVALLMIAGAWRWRLRGRTTTRSLVCMAVLAGTMGWLGCGGSDRCDVSAGQVEPGATGRYSAIAARDGRVVVSAYEESLGDLVLLDIDPKAADPTSTIDKRYVIDGAPDLEPLYATCSYRGGVLGEGPDVGAWTSVVLANDRGKPRARVAYHDIDNGALRFASERGVADWHKHTIDAGDSGVAGLYTSVALNPEGMPAIAYAVVGLPGPDNTRVSELRFAQARTTEPEQANDWIIQVVDQVTISCAGLCASGETCVADMSARESCAMPTADCAAGCGADVCVQGMCLSAIPNPPAVDLPQGTGLFNNLVFLPDGRAAIAYYHRATTDLMLRVGDNGNWIAHALDAAFDTDTGMWANMVMDVDGVLHVAYQDALADRLLYTTWQGGQTSSIEVVDNGLRTNDRPHPVGASAALVIDASGRISVAYQDGLTHDLLIATREVSSWTRNDLASGPDLNGFFVTATPYQEYAVISSYTYERTSNVLGQLMISRTQ